MKYIYPLLNKGKLSVIGVLPMVICIACQRDAPRYEPDVLGDQNKKYNTPLTVQNKQITVPKPCTFRDSLLERYKNHSLVLAHIFKHIDPCALGKISYLEPSSSGEKSMDEQEIWILPVYPKHGQNDLSACIEASQWPVSRGGENKTSIDLDRQAAKRIFNNIPDKFCIEFVRDREKGILIGTEYITIKHGLGSPHSEKNSFTLEAFLLASPCLDNDSYNLVAFVKSNQQWCYYDGDATKVISNEDAIHLSRLGSHFFYCKSR